MGNSTVKLPLPAIQGDTEPPETPREKASKVGDTGIESQRKDNRPELVLKAPIRDVLDREGRLPDYVTYYEHRTQPQNVPQLPGDHSVKSVNMDIEKSFTFRAGTFHSKNKYLKNEPIVPKESQSNFENKTMTPKRKLQLTDSSFGDAQQLNLLESSAFSFKLEREHAQVGLQNDEDNDSLIIVDKDDKIIKTSSHIFDFMYSNR